MKSCEAIQHRKRNVTLTCASGITVVWITDEVVMAPTLGNMIFSSAMGVVATEDGCATDKTSPYSRCVHRTDFISLTIAVGAAFRRG